MPAAEAVAARLNWLFDVVAAPVPGEDAGDPSWRRYTDAEVGAAVAEALGIPERAGRELIERLRAGAPAEPAQLHALAGFFGVEPVFFGEDVAEVDAEGERLLDGVLRDCGIRACLVCRTPAPPPARRREQVRKVLHTVRPAPLRSADVVSRPHPRTSEDHEAWWRGHPGDERGAPMTAPLNQARLRTWCHDLVRDLGIRAPFGPEELCGRLGEERGRPIKVRATDLGATTGVGHLVPKRRADYILVEHTAPASQRALVIYHEVVHLVRDHLEAGDSLTCGLIAGDPAQAGAYADWREWEAEAGARTLSAMSRERPRPNRLPVAAGEAEQSIAAAFGFVAKER